MNNILPKTTAEAVRVYDLMALMAPYTGVVATLVRETEDAFADDPFWADTCGYPLESAGGAICALPEDLHGHVGQHPFQQVSAEAFGPAPVMPTTGYPRELVVHETNPWAKTPVLDALVDCEPWTNGTVPENRTYVTRWCDCEVSFCHPDYRVAHGRTYGHKVEKVCGWYHTSEADALTDLIRALGESAA